MHKWQLRKLTKQTKNMKLIYIAVETVINRLVSIRDANNN